MYIIILKRYCSKISLNFLSLKYMNTDLIYPVNYNIKKIYVMIHT